MSEKGRALTYFFRRAQIQLDTAGKFFLHLGHVMLVLWDINLRLGTF